MVKILSDTYTTFKSIFLGMGVTWRHLFKKNVTVHYPEERDVLPERVRLKLDVNIDDCIGCRLCERACPVDCITIGTIKSTDDDDLGETSTGHKKKLWVNHFDIDMAKCCYCELCVHPCPTDCITMVEDYEYSVYDRNNLVLSFSDMTPEQIEEAQAKLEQEAEDKRRKKEEARQARKEKPESGSGEKSADMPESGPGSENDGDASTGDGERQAAREARRAEREKRKAEKDAQSVDSEKRQTEKETRPVDREKRQTEKATQPVDREKSRAEREARRAARKKEREEKKKSGD